MGAGKSTIGRILATRLQYRFFDTDRLIISKFQKSVSKIFQQDGEQAFRDTEASILEDLSTQKRLVISTGGGTLTRDALFNLAHESGTIIYLKAPLEVLFERAIFSRKDRPMLNVPNAEQVFRERFEARESFYNRSHLIIETFEKKSEAVVDEIIQCLSVESPKS